MFSSTLKKTLSIWKTNHSKRCAKAPLFSGSAYFSNCVPKVFSEKWVAHGGEISSGTTFDVRARYFFAIDPLEPWVTKLFSKSVMVIHAGWIVHCVDEAFQVPIAEYILDDRFVPAPPYKLVGNSAPPTYVPLSDPGESTDTESGEFGPPPVQTSDMPSTPTSVPQKRKREQAYFDSPSGSLVFSGFDKDGLPRRPRKQRKLRFDPSFSPEGGSSSKETVRAAGFDWLQDVSRDGGEFGEEHGQHRRPTPLRGYMTTVRSPDTPDKPLVNKGLSAMYRRPAVNEHIQKSIHASSPAINKQGKTLPVRTIDFTNLPPPSRRWRFPDATKHGDTSMTLSAVRPVEHKAKTPKRISFANHARVSVYMVSPRRPDTKDDVEPGLAQQSMSKEFGNGPEADEKTRMASGNVNCPDDSTAEAIKDLTPRTDSPKVTDDPAWLLDPDQPENGALTLTMEDVQAMRRHLLESAWENGVDNGPLATLFELGKTFRGMAFHHVW